MENLSEDEKTVIESYRRLVKDQFGSITPVVHRGQLVGLDRHVKENVPRRVREVHKDGK